MSRRYPQYEYNDFDANREDFNEREMNSDIKTNRPYEEKTAVPAPMKGIVDNTSLVKLREEPTPDAKVLTTLTKGTKVEILETYRDDFYKVRVNDSTTGYISSKFLKVV